MNENKEYKFRGKTKNGDWVYGNSHTNSAICISDEEYVEVELDTITRYTGCKDKNGNCIYCGDIVKGLEYPDFLWGDDGEVDAVVIYSDNEPHYMISMGIDVTIVLEQDARLCFSETKVTSVIEVIGNVFDNNDKYLMNVWNSNKEHQYMRS